LPIDSDPVLHHAHPKNYEYIMHDPKGEFGGHKVYFDNEGLISNLENIHSQNKDAKYRVAFMGDSFVEGKELSYDDTFVGILGAESDKKAIIKNYGVRSYSPILYLLQWRELVRRFNPTHVILLLYSNDIPDDIKWSRTAVYSDDGELLAVVGEGCGAYKKFFRNLYVARLLRKIQLQISWFLENWNESKNIVGGMVEENPELTEMSTEFVLKLSKEVKESGAEFVIMVVPSKYRLVNNIYGDPEPEFSDKWKKWAEANSVDFIDLVSQFAEAGKKGEKLFFEIDIHYNAKGHKVAAEVIRQKYP
jgi:lysophospholipase L1-like esterase